MPRLIGQSSWMEGPISARARVIRSLETREHALKAADLAKLLGVTRQHVYKLAAEGSIPSFRIGVAVRFDPALVAEWLCHKMPAPAVIAETRRIAV